MVGPPYLVLSLCLLHGGLGTIPSKESSTRLGGSFDLYELVENTA